MVNRRSGLRFGGWVIGVEIKMKAKINPEVF
jgi:hypothetical protein